jgi:hypothetical protein
MKIVEIEALKFKINQAIETKDEDEIRELREVFKQSIIDNADKRFQYFSLLIGLLSRREFLELSIAWDYFFLLKNYRELLTDSQKIEFISKFASIYQFFHEKSLDSIKVLLYQALLDRNEAEYNECVDAIDTSFFGVNHFPSEIFDFCLNIFHDPAFLGFDRSWYLMFVFDLNFDLLSFEQQNILLSELEMLFGKTKYWMSNFMITQILGKRYRDERALKVLTRLMKIADENPRSFVPHGFEHIALTFQNESLANQAYSQLIRMQNDPSIKVREEVSASLLKVQYYLNHTDIRV